MPGPIRYREVLDFCMQETWALQADKLAVIVELVAMRLAGRKLTRAQIAERIGPRSPRAQARVVEGGTGGKAVAVIPVHGVLAHRMGGLNDTSGGTSTEGLARRFRGAVDDPGIGAILLDFNSPGGAIGGVPELHAQIMQARGRKPIVAIANGVMASAAYWLASAADEVVATDSAEVGNIGAYVIHRDLSAALEKEGIRTTLISAGKFKVEGNPFEPLTDEGKAAIQARVDEGYGMFTKAVAKGRGVPVDKVRNGYGEGRAVSAQRALELGMIDRIATMEATLGRLLSRGNRTSVVQAHALEDEEGDGDEGELAAAALEERQDGDRTVLRKIEPAPCSCTEPCGFAHYRYASPIPEGMAEPAAAAPAAAPAPGASAPAASAAPVEPAPASPPAPALEGDRPAAPAAAPPAPPTDNAETHPEVYQRLLELHRE